MSGGASKCDRSPRDRDRSPAPYSENLRHRSRRNDDRDDRDVNNDDRRSQAGSTNGMATDGAQLV